MKVRFTTTAIAEITKSTTIAERNPMAAKAVIWRIEQVIARISWFPDIARGVDPMELRVFPVVPVPTSSFTL